MIHELETQVASFLDFSLLEAFRGVSRLVLQSPLRSVQTCCPIIQVTAAMSAAQCEYRVTNTSTGCAYTSAHFSQTLGQDGEVRV